MTDLGREVLSRIIYLYQGSLAAEALGRVVGVHDFAVCPGNPRPDVGGTGGSCIEAFYSARRLG